MDELMPTVVYAVNLLAPLIPFLTKAGEKVAEQVGEASYKKVKALYEAIRNKFASDDDEYALQTLKRFEEQPANDNRKAALVSVVTDKATTDPVFANQLDRFVQEAKQDGNITQFATRVYGNARVGKIYNIGQAGQITETKTLKE